MLAQNFRLLVQLVHRSIFPIQSIVSQACRQRHLSIVTLPRPLVTQQRRMLATPPPHINVRSEVYEKADLLPNDPPLTVT